MRIFGREHSNPRLGRHGPFRACRDNQLRWASAPTRLGDLPIQFAQVLVGSLVINAGIYIGYPRGDSEWADGIRLEDPQDGRLRFRENDYLEAWLDAGVRDIAVVGLPYHPDAQCPEFGDRSIRSSGARADKSEGSTRNRCPQRRRPQARRLRASGSPR